MALSEALPPRLMDKADGGGEGGGVGCGTWGPHKTKPCSFGSLYVFVTRVRIWCSGSHFFATGTPKPTPLSPSLSLSTPTPFFITLLFSIFRCVALNRSLREGTRLRRPRLLVERLCCAFLQADELREEAGAGWKEGEWSVGRRLGGGQAVVR